MKAELTGIHAALVNEQTQIATDNARACCSSQIGKQVLYTEAQRCLIHHKILIAIASHVIDYLNTYFY